MEIQALNIHHEIGLPPKVSVIVPIYKAERTLLRCLDSLKVQTFTNFEVLMVDDGSPDRCGEMIDEYAAKDSRFKAFHKPNGGVSSARQYGIDHAIGEYTIHADPDDWVEPTMLEDLYGRAKEEDADMVICDYFTNTYKGQHYNCQKPTNLSHNVVLRDLFGKIHGSCCNKLIKLSCYREYNIQFPIDMSRFEDQYVVASLLLRDIRVTYWPVAYYHYVRDDDNTLSRFFSEEIHSQNILARDKFYNLLKNTSISQKIYEQKTYIIFASAFWGGQNLYSSKTFKKRFASYEGVVENVVSSFWKRNLMIIACRGGYQFVIKLINIIMRIKRLLTIHS